MTYGPSKLTASQIAEAFPDCLDIVQREMRRIKRELGIYTRVAYRIKAVWASKETKDFWLLALKVCYMKSDKRYSHYDKLRAIQQLMRHEKYGVSDEDIERAKSVDIWTLYPFQRHHGKTACCPFHDDKTPSFAVRRGKWICFACGLKGDAIDFVMRRDGVNFPVAVRILKGQ